MTIPEKHILDQANESLFQYDRWRHTFLNVVLRVAASLGLILLLINIPNFRGAELAIFSAVYGMLLIFTFAPLPYSFRAGALVTAGYFVGTYALVQFGPWSGALVYFLGITIFASLLFDERLDWWILSVNVITILVIGILNISGRFALLSTEISTPRPGDWLTYGADYVVFGIGLTWAINLLKNEFKSVAGQFQSALNFLSKDRSELENRVNERTAGLIKKTEQLRAASYIARQTADIQDLASILNEVVNLVTDQFGFYHAGIFLLNESGKEMILQAASSEGGKRMVGRGHSFQVGSKSIVGYAASQKKPRIALNAGSDAVFFNNPDLPTTRSEMALPLMIRDRVLGVLDIQSEQSQAFSVDDIDVLQTLADQIAVAIENMRLLDESQSALMQKENLTAAQTRGAWRQMIQEGNLAFTYTPLGMQPGTAVQEPGQGIKVPITLRGQNIGTISLTRKNNVPLNNLDIDLINEVAYQTGLAVDNVRLVEDATERARQEQTVGELAARFSQSADIDSLLQTAAREIGQIADVAEVTVYVGQIPEQIQQKKRTRRTSE